MPLLPVRGFAEGSAPIPPQRLNIVFITIYQWSYVR
jgi:hypothetical protein